MSSLTFWLQSSLRRVFPTSGPPADPFPGVRAARGGSVSFQACVRNTGCGCVDVRIVVDAPDDVPVRVRRVGYVAVAHHNTECEADELDGVGHLPGLAPDPLYPEQKALVGPFETVAFWVSVAVPPGARPADAVLRVRLEGDGEARSLDATVRISEVTLQPPDFPVTHWFYADALCDWYRVPPYGPEFWRLVRPYMADLAAHGSTCQYVPLLTPPTDGVKRPHQLLGVEEARPGEFRFDFADVRRWVGMARECGARWFEWTHFFTQWGARNALRVYRRNADPESLLWPPDTSATSPTYRAFLAQLLPELRTFLEREGLLDCSFFHVSDEPHGDHVPYYRAARELLRELAPWMKVSDALSDLEYGKLGLTDIPIPSIGAAREYAEAGIPAWAYFCCGPRGRYLNRLIDTPLPKIRMSGWLFHRFDARGFLHWGYNYWYRSQTQDLIDPFTEQSGAAWPGWAYGDPFVVYPGTDGPLDSIRWEVWAESLQDLALLKTLDVAPEDPSLADLRGYDDFPKAEAWIDEARARLLAAR